MVEGWYMLGCVLYVLVLAHRVIVVGDRYLIQGSTLDEKSSTVRFDLPRTAAYTFILQSS